MELSETTEANIRKWVSEGLSLSKIQQKLADECSCSLTFMELRFIVDDLDLDLKEAPSKQSKGQNTLLDVNPHSASTDPHSLFNDTAAGASGQVAVSVDRVQRPNAVASGSVTFSDGEQGSWQIDQLGRLAIIPSNKSYKPSPTDIEEFQIALQAQLQG